MQLARGASAANYDLLILFTYLHIIISIIRYPLQVVAKNSENRGALAIFGTALYSACEFVRLFVRLLVCSHQYVSLMSKTLRLQIYCHCP
jgi:uncharacterized membrane protein